MHFLSSNAAYNDTIDSLQNEYKDDNSNTLIALGAHELNYDYFKTLKTKFDKIIVFNQEPLKATQRIFMNDNYAKWIKSADEVWDYDEENIDTLSALKNAVSFHKLLPYKDWSAYKNTTKDIDILFYGNFNEHRIKLLKALSTKYKLCIANGHFTDLDAYIARSKILLNIHYYYECAMQEQARIIRWIGAPCRIISEKSKHNYLNVEEMLYEDLFNI